MLLPANYIDQDIPSRVLLKNALRSEYERGLYVYFVFQTKIHQCISNVETIPKLEISLENNTQLRSKE